MSAFSADNPGPNLPMSPMSPKRPSSPEDIFLTSKKFPGLEPDRGSTGPEAAPPGKSKSGRVAVTVAVLMLVIGGIAWVVQYLPSYKKLPEQNKGTVKKERRDLLRFADAKDGEIKNIKAVWDPRDEDYAFEVEHGSRGSYDFYFENSYAGSVQIGLESTSCDCSDVKVALLSSSELKTKFDQLESRRRAGERDSIFSEQDLPWVVLDKIKGFTVPENGKGLVRIGWHARKAEGARLRLNVGVWTYPDEHAAQRSWINFETLTVVVPKLFFDTGKVSMGTLAGGTAKGRAIAWSATRTKLDLQVANDDALCAWKVTPLDKQTLKQVEAGLRKSGLNTRVRSASAVELTIAEEKDGNVLEQGPFQRRPTLTLDGESRQEGLPVYHGRVQGDVKIGGLDDSGKIQLNSFPAKDGTPTQRLFLWAEPKVVLAVDRRSPPFLDVKLIESVKEATEKERKWVLEVKVPRGSPPGPFAEESAIMLRTNTVPPRRIRIPIVGTAVPG